MTNINDQGSTATELIFVRAYHRLPGISEGEWIRYYRPSTFGEFRRELKDYIQHQIGLFTVSAEYGEYFSVAEFDGPMESMDEYEESVFRSALAKADRPIPLSELHPLDSLRGLQAVILHRISRDCLADVVMGVELFEYVIECAIPGDDNRNPGSYISVLNVSQFATSFIDGLLESIKNINDTWRYDPYWKFVGERMAPLKPLLDNMHRAVHQTTWPRDDLSLGRLLLVVDYFKQVVEDEWCC